MVFCLNQSVLHIIKMEEGPDHGFHYILFFFLPWRFKTRMRRVESCGIHEHESRKVVRIYDTYTGFI